MTAKKLSPPELTPEQASARANFVKRQKAASAAPRLKVVNGKITIPLPGAEGEGIGTFLLMGAVGTGDFDFMKGLLSQLANAGSIEGQVDEAGLNFMVAVIKDIKPRDHVETMLAAQMAATHMAAMTFARRLAHVDNIPQQDSAVGALNKLTRTFATQMEALKRYRTSGEQKVTVQHVSISEGGQAIVGNVTQAPRRPSVNETPALPPASSDSPMPFPTVLEEPPRAAVPRKGKRME